MKNKLIEILTTEKDPTIRFEILEKFYHQVSDEADINLVINLLDNDPDPCVRHEAAAQLFRIEENKSPLMVNVKNRAIEMLFYKAHTDTSTVVRHEAIEALGYLAEASHIEELQSFTTSDDSDIQSTAIIAYTAARKRIDHNLSAKELGDYLVNSWQPSTLGN